MNKKNLLKFTISTFMLLALIVPRVAQAATVADLQDTVTKAYKLCAVDAEKYANSCKQAEAINKVKEAAATKPESQQAAYIKQKLPKYESTKLGVNKSYLIAVKEGNISKAGDVIGAATAKSDCNNGGVKVSVDVDGNDNCVGGNGQNPIYAYLRGLILFMGGAIGLAVVITIIIAGIQYSSSAGNPAAITKAKERLTNAVIGLVLYLFLAAILRYLVPQIFAWYLLNSHYF